MPHTARTNLPYPYLRVRHLGERAWEEADSRLAGINTPTQLARRQQRTAAKFRRVFGPMPDTNKDVACRTVKRFSYQGVIVTQIVITSDLGYEISALICVKEGLQGSLPGLVWASGHNEDGSFTANYLKMSLYAALNGFLVLAFDPAGQGCRREVFHDDDDPVFWSPSKQHQSLGASVMLIEDQLARFMARDCVTAVSCLCQQSGVDRDRIGFAGQSGGGLQTYLAIGADPRIKAAVPLQATSSRRGAFQQMQMRDAEQIFYRCWREGLDCHEMGLLFAPKPLRIVSEYGYFDQVDIYRKLLPAYTAAGCADRIEIASTGCSHGLSRSSRETAMQWLNRWLAPPVPLPFEPDWQDYDEFREHLRKELLATNLKSRGILNFCRTQAEKRASRRSGTKFAVARIRHLKGVAAGNGRRAQTENMIVAAGPGHYGKRLAIGSEYSVPFDLIPGTGPARVTAVIADENGRKSDWSKRLIRQCVRTAEQTIAIDVFNCGAVRSDRTDPSAGQSAQRDLYYRKNRRFFDPSVYHAFDAFMAGSSPIGLAMEEIRLVLRHTGLIRRRLVFYGRGWPALSLLFLAPGMSNVTAWHAAGIPESYESLLRRGEMVYGYDYLVPDILKNTDIPLVVRHLRKRGTVCSGFSLNSVVDV